MIQIRLRSLFAVSLIGTAPLLAQNVAPDNSAAPDDDVFIKSHPFQIPNKQGARALYDAAVAHVEAGRWTEAVTAIERLIDEHSGSVIELPLDSQVRKRSSQPVYRGAADAARELFTRLPASARAAYTDRYAALAQQLLERARSALDTTALANVAHRYPLTSAARDAWWTLGDLEAEAGDIEAARAAWNRAGASMPGTEIPAELALRARWSPDDGAVRASRASFLTLTNAGADSEELPATDAHGWEKAPRMDEHGGIPFKPDSFNSFPIIAGDSVLASNSLTLSCIDSLTGNLRWRSAEAPGWAEVIAGRFRARDNVAVPFSEFFDGIDRESLMLAPAAGSGIAVAALQVPFTQNGKNVYQGQILIRYVIPDRRLFAFDLESGKSLWNHCPPPTWDGSDSGTFTQRMRVAGPPVIAGARLLVPMWRPQGRISYWVACYDLSSGAYLWSTQVASGQRPLNMFGRLEHEFCAPPLVVVGEKVIAQSQLGTVAALDLFNGELLWQTVYDQIEILGADGMQARPRITVWREAPPAVANGVVVVTPTDSFYMLGIDLNDGAVLWELESKFLGDDGRMNATWCLLGVRDDAVYVGGRSVIALRSPEGIAQRPTTIQASEGLYGDGYADPSSRPRAVLTARNVIVATREGTLILDRVSLHSNQDIVSSARWGKDRGGGLGNLAIGNGAMFALSGQSLWGVLDWRSIEARLEEESSRHQDDSAVASRFGKFLRERASDELNSSKPQAALEHVQRAEKILQGAANSSEPQAREALFFALRLEARVLQKLAQASLSLERLERAVPLAPDPGQLALVLAEIVRTSSVTDPRRFDPALADLERQCGDMEFPSEGNEHDDEAHSVLRWVIEQRVKNAASHADLAKEFAALIDLLDRCGDGPLSPAVAEPPGEKKETPAMRIELRLASGAGAQAAWQPIEQKARVAFEAVRAGGDPAALERVARLFPYTIAAREARDARLRLAVEAGDSAASVRAAFEELPPDWSAQNSTARQARLVWLAALALKTDGNPRYANSILQRLAQFQPQVQADEHDPSATFASLARAAESATAAALSNARPAHFAAADHNVENKLGDCVLLGELDLGAKSVFIVAGRDNFSALDADGTLLWTRPVESALAPTAWFKNALLVPAASSGLAATWTGARVLRIWRGSIAALDGATGKELWSFDVRGNLNDSPLSSDGGVLTVSTVIPGASAHLIGIDLGRGTQLWNRTCPPGLWAQPIVGSGLAVLLPKFPPFHKAEVVEIATGTTARELDVGQIVPIEDRSAAWIENGRLVLPHFTPSGASGTSDGLNAFDLDTGARAWRVPGDSVRDLDSIVRCGSDTYLVYRVTSTAAAAGNLKELDTRIGAVREVSGVSIGPDDFPIGLRQHCVTRLQAPYLFLRSPAPGAKDDTLVRAVHLPYGQRWAYRLHISQGDLYSHILPLPGVSTHLVALAYTEGARGNSGRGESPTRLVLLDRETGEMRGNRIDLTTAMGRAEAMEMATFGNLLILSGKDQTMIMAGAETEEQR